MVLPVLSDQCLDTPPYVVRNFIPPNAAQQDSERGISHGLLLNTIYELCPMFTKKVLKCSCGETL